MTNRWSIDCKYGDVPVRYGMMTHRWYTLINMMNLSMVCLQKNGDLPVRCVKLAEGGSSDTSLSELNHVVTRGCMKVSPENGPGIIKQWIGLMEILNPKPYKISFKHIRWIKHHLGPISGSFLLVFFSVCYVFSVSGLWKRFGGTNLLLCLRVVQSMQLSSSSYAWIPSLEV